MKTAYIAYPPLFQILSNPPSLSLVSSSELRHIWYGILLNDTMDLLMSSLRNFISEGSWSGFYPSTFLQPVNGSKNSLLYWVFKLNLFKYFFVCLSRKTLERFFIFLHHWFCSYKPQILTDQTGLTIQFVVLRKHLCSCVQKIKNKHDGGADVAFFLFRRVILIA